MKQFPPGLYDILHTQKLHKQLEDAGLLDKAVWEKFEPEELKAHLAVPLAREIAQFISENILGSKRSEFEAALNKAFDSPALWLVLIESIKPLSIEVLHQIKPEAPLPELTVRPDTPVSVSSLLTGSSRSPALRSQIIKELASCDKADWLVSFIKFAGIVPLLPALREFTQTPADDGGPRLRIATTSYMGATDLKAISELLALPNTEIRVSYDTKRTRLHAKAYLFHRNSGFGSAYIGSANVSKAALDEGLEWTAKVSQYETEHLWQHALATFESHWEDQTEFTPCGIDNLEELGQALSQERGESQGEGGMGETLSFFDLRPYGYQQAILDDIAAERSAGKRKHLVIAATGTGKTMIAAFDYKYFCGPEGGRPRLLFVAHREEILKQARSAFRQVLRDGSFGDLVAGGAQQVQMDHLFCTVQSWNSRSRNFDQLSPDHFDYVVLDEAHHASASTYQALIDHIVPQSLLGLTATPERTDGRDIRNDFGGAFTHEIRLSEAIERALLSPFHYYGVPDLEGLDFTSVAWKKGGYDKSQLNNLLEGNAARANWVLSQVDRYVANIKQIRALGFCVSVAHAEFMVNYCNDNDLSAIALSADTPKVERQQAQRRLERREIQIIFTVDLYNEGVDIPSVDTVVFLRPTESLTLFLQQLGRGLRLHDEKSHLTVLDFIAPQNRKFNFAKRFQSLTSRPELRIDKQITADMPYMPAGCLVHLEKQAKEYVLENIRAAAASLRGERLLSELRQLQSAVDGDVSLQQMIDYLHLDSPDEIYKKGLPHELLAKARATGDDNVIAEASETYKLNKGFRRFMLMDDTNLIADAKLLVESGTCEGVRIKELLHSVLWGVNKPAEGRLEQVHAYFADHSALKHDLVELLDWLLTAKVPLPEKQFNGFTESLNLHASYTREQVLLSLGLGSFESPRASREGVLHVPDRKLDVFFADINKSENDFSPTTMYEDYAITDKLFHWQSQSNTGDSSSVGQRYINHAEQGYTPLLFIRNRKKLENKMTAPYYYAGPLKYTRHEGSKPISFVWELEHALSAKAMVWAGRS
ncbi:MAG: DUF3427 domain-containing protein [Gammaproteobacteria bacterium]|nr:DUF3427 domain-containing protein [Gammaproteobacteria bacterium]